MCEICFYSGGRLEGGEILEIGEQGGGGHAEIYVCMYVSFPQEKPVRDGEFAE